MKGYAHMRAPGVAVELLDRAQRFVACFPDTMPWVPTQWISCHAVASVLAPYLPGTRVAHGVFSVLNHGVDYDHSWLVFDAHADWVLDPYPIAEVGGPVLRHVSPAAPWALAYRERVLHHLDWAVIVSEMAVLQEALKQRWSRALLQAP